MGCKNVPAAYPNSNSEDFTWNAVWQSGAVIQNDGWSFEMFIPYSAIRFGKKDVQTGDLILPDAEEKPNSNLHGILLIRT